MTSSHETQAGTSEMGCGRAELLLQFSLVPEEVHGSTRYVSLPVWEIVGAASPLFSFDQSHLLGWPGPGNTVPSRGEFAP